MRFITIRKLLALVVFAVVAVVVLGVGYIRLMELNWTRIEITPGPLRNSFGTYEVHMDVDGTTRRFLVHVPPGGVNEPVPLVVTLHGRGGSADTVDSNSRMTARADEEGFIVAMPDGYKKQWSDWRTGAGVDDVKFITQMIASIKAQLPVDESRIYAMGMSNGAFMTSRLACEAADQFAAFAMVDGTSKTNFEDWCDPGEPVSLIVFLSTKDPIVPFNGKGGYTWRPPFKKAAQVEPARSFIDFWTGHNDCATGSVSPERLEDRNTRDDSTVTLYEYDNCDGGAELHYYQVEGAGHTWPGGKQYATPWIIGTTNRDVDASALIWEFFSGRSKSATSR